MPDVTVTVNQTGGTPDFTVIQTALDDSDVTDGFYRAEVQDASAYVENIDMIGSTGTPTVANYMHLTVTDGAYHAGVVGAGASITPTGADHAVILSEPFARISKMLVVASTDTTQSLECIRFDSDNGLVDRCILDSNERGVSRTDGDAVYIDTNDITCQVYNTVIIDSSRNGIQIFNRNTVLNFEFVTAYQNSVTEASASQFGTFMLPRTGTSPPPTINSYNNVAAATDPGPDWISFGTPIVNASNNASEDTTAIGTGPLTGLVPADEWTDPTNFDLTILDTNSQIHLAGVTRVFPDVRPNAGIDIRGVTRPSPPSIGAYEIAVAGAVGVFVGATELTAVGDISIGGTNVLEVFVGSTKVFPP